MPAPSRYTPGPIPGLSRETVAALYAEFRRLADDLQTQSRPDAVIPLQQDRLQAAAGQFLRVSPPAEGMVLTLPAPDPTNMGERNAVTVFIELPYGPLDVAATPKVNPDRSVTAATVNGAAMARFTVAGVVRFFSNGLDQWQSTSSLPIAVDEQGNVAIPTPGPTGATGATGPQGAKGAFGPSGLDGQAGADGADGFPGATGAQGIQGLMGLSGNDGADGADGFPGTPGAQGPQGATGLDGAAGLMGFMGNDGVDGQDGFPGLPGATGPQGPAGSGSGGGTSFPGQDGNDGQDGTTWVQTVILPASVSGALSTATVNLGTSPRFSGTFDITGLSGLTTNAIIPVGRAVTPAGSQDEAEEQLVCSGYALSSTTIRVYYESVGGGPISGSISFWYLVPDVTLAATPTVSPGQQLGLQIDAAGPGTAIALTGPEQGENIRYGTIQTFAGGGSNTITLNADATVLQTTNTNTIQGITGGVEGRTLRLLHVGGGGTLTTVSPNDAAATATDRIQYSTGAHVFGNNSTGILGGYLIYLNSRWHLIPATLLRDDMTWLGSQTFSASVQLSGVISPTTLSANQDNYNPAGWATANVVRLITNDTTARNITGFAAPALGGETKLILNIGLSGGVNGTIALVSDSASSSAGNRISMPGATGVSAATNLIMVPGAGCFIWYDSTSAIWRAPLESA